MNTLAIVGNLTDDPELRFSAAGKAVASFSVAVNRRTRDESGQWDDKLDGFFRCSCFGSLAENVAESLSKGTRVAVVGRLVRNAWQNDEGETRRSIEIQVEGVGPDLRFATAAVSRKGAA